MDLLQKFARGALGFFIGLMVGMWIITATTYLTAGNRDVVKNWAINSSIYDNTLTNALQVSASDGESSSVITSDLLSQALHQTFDSAYLQQSGNTIINATYDWLEGKTAAITFSIPVQTKAEEFRKNLTALLTQKLQSLPVCPGKTAPETDQLTCLPAGVSANDYAAQLTRPSSNNTFLNEPLTQDAFGQSQPQTAMLPIIYNWLRVLFWALPAAILVLGGAYVFLTPDKLKGLMRLGRQWVFNASITFVGGLILWSVGGLIDVSPAVEGRDPQQTEVIASLVNSVLQVILPDIGRTLALCSGAFVLIGGLLWLGVFLWKRRAPKRPSLPLPSSSGSPVPAGPEQLPPVRKIDF